MRRGTHRLDGRDVHRIALSLLVLAAMALPPPSGAAGITPHPGGVRDSVVWKKPSAPAAPVHRRQTTSLGGLPFEITARHFGPSTLTEVGAVISGLSHGPEIDRLSVYVATRRELNARCGVWTMACYYPWAGRIIVAGDPDPVSGVPRNLVIAHEYGHHLANNRRSDVWSSLATGTKRWATYEDICGLTRSGMVFPGNQGARYWENPGEAFAQAYGLLHFPEGEPDWNYSPHLSPDEGSRAALLSDLVKPWDGPRLTRRWIRTEREVEAPLDGRIRISARGPAASRFRILLEDPATGTTLASAPSDARGRSELTFNNCGHRRVTVAIRSVQGPKAPVLTRTSLP